jgi:16S rRNA (uracil1498-N3)-methyltransferase
VLRLTQGAEVEVFDDAGRVGRGVLTIFGSRVAVRVDAVGKAPPLGASVRLTVAAAVPKGDRADWMVEKLAELGVAEFIPLSAARSVVLPGGTNKRERWVRIATEAAKQSRRSGVMRVGELTKVEEAMKRAGLAWYLATEPGVNPIGIAEAIAGAAAAAELLAFVGPEGGWTDDELAQFAAAGARAVRLTNTILRVETAAVAVAAVVGSVGPGRGRGGDASPHEGGAP